MKRLLIAVTTFLCLTAGTIGVLHARGPALSQRDVKGMQQHVDEMARKSPQKYQAMVQRAGGNVLHCCSCHEEVCPAGWREKAGIP